MIFIPIILVFLTEVAATREKVLVARIGTFGNDKYLYVHPKEYVVFNGSIIYGNSSNSLTNESMVLNCWLDNIKVGVIVNWTDTALSVPLAVNSSQELTITFFGLRLGRANVFCNISLAGNSSTIFQQKVVQLVVNRIVSGHDIPFRVILSLFIITISFITGCRIDCVLISEVLKNPPILFVGSLSKFVLMPLIALCVAKTTRIGNEFGMGLLIFVCAFGGGVRNMWTLSYEGDLGLTMTMAFASSMFSIVLMPFLLYVFGRFFIDFETVEIPFGDMFLNLIMIILPVMFGIIFRSYWQKRANLLRDQFHLSGILLAILIIAYGTYVNSYIYLLIYQNLYLIPIGIVLPWIGFCVGYPLVKLARGSKGQAIDIGLETGFQNCGIAILIAKYAMSQPEGDIASAVIFILIFFMPVTLYIGNIVIIVKKKCFPKNVPNGQDFNTGMDMNVDRENLLKIPCQSNNTN